MRAPIPRHTVMMTQTPVNVTYFVVLLTVNMKYSYQADQITQLIQFTRHTPYVVVVVLKLYRRLTYDCNVALVLSCRADDEIR